METLEQNLRDELRQMPDRLPSSTAMLGRVRRRRARNKLALTGTMGVVLVLTVGVGFALRNEVSTEPPTPPAGPAAGSVKIVVNEFPYFSDPNHGFVLAFSCDPAPCTSYVASTVDGGASWQLHPVPEGAGTAAEDSGLGAELRVFDNNNVLLDGYDRIRRWASSDGGKTWREMSFQPQGSVDEIPPGAQVNADYDVRAPISLVVTRPDGHSFRLANPPKFSTDLPTGEILMAADGSYWYEELNESRGWLFYSRDQGRTWHELKPPGKPPVGVGQRKLMTHDGRTVYWYFAGKAWRTTDDGAHWTAISVPEVSVKEGDHGMRGEVRLDNGIQFTDSANGKVFVVSATSTKFVPSTPDVTAVVSWGGARYVQQLKVEDPISHSIDGINWVEMKLG